jgi:hypothetical protein
MLFDNIGLNNTPTAAQVGARLLNSANITFDRMLNMAYNDYNSFWGLEAQGGPSGLDILNALGTSAFTMMAIAWSRVEMLSTVATLVGKSDLVDLNRLLPPYDFTWNQDGSLASATPK